MPAWQLHQVYTDRDTHDWVQKGCRSAGIGCLECKQPVIDGILAEQQPMFERASNTWTTHLVKSIVADGCERARAIARKPCATCAKPWVWATPDAGVHHPGGAANERARPLRRRPASAPPLATVFGEAVLDAPAVCSSRRTRCGCFWKALKARWIYCSPDPQAKPQCAGHPDGARHRPVHEVHRRHARRAHGTGC